MLLGTDYAKSAQRKCLEATRKCMLEVTKRERLLTACYLEALTICNAFWRALLYNEAGQKTASALGLNGFQTCLGVPKACLGHFAKALSEIERLTRHTSNSSYMQPFIIKALQSSLFSDTHLRVRLLRGGGHCAFFLRRACLVQGKGTFKATWNSFSLSCSWTVAVASLLLEWRQKLFSWGHDVLIKLL